MLLIASGSWTLRWVTLGESRVSYSLGIDVGATFVAAAVGRTTTVEMFALAKQAAMAPAVVSREDDGSLATGVTTRNPVTGTLDRANRGVINRLGDPAPVLLGGEAYEATDLVSVLLRDVVHQVTKTQGKPPEQLVLSHPAGWGPFRRALFGQAARKAGLGKPVMVTEPEAVAARYARFRPWNDGESVVVYDFGGTTFNATVLSKHSGQVRILGEPARTDGLGGDVLDQAILDHVNRITSGALDRLDKHRPQTTAALDSLRQACIQAKEALSTNTETTFPVVLPGKRFDVRLTRSEFEGLVRSSIEHTLSAVSQAVQSAQVQPDALSAVLLAGGSSNIPLVAEMVSTEFRCPLIADSQPQHVVALGSAMLAGQVAEHEWSLHEGRHHRTRLNEDRRSTADTATESRTAAAKPAGSSERHGAQVSISAQRATDMIPQQRTTGLPEPQATPLRHVEVAAARTPVGRGPANADIRAAQAAAPASIATLPPPTQATPPADCQPPAQQHAEPQGDQSRLLAFLDRARRPQVLVGTGLAVALAGSILFAIFAGTANTPPPRLAPPVRPLPNAVANGGPQAAMPTVGATIRVGNSPSFVASSPNGEHVYVASGNDQSLTVVDTAVNQVTATIPIAAGPPQFLTFAPDGRTLYVTVSNNQGTIHAIDVLDTASNAVIATIPQPGMPLRVAVSPDGRRLYVANHEIPSVSVIDTATNTVIGQVNVAPNPHWVTFSPDGSRAYTANHESDLVSVIDTATLQVLATIPVGTSPHSIAANPQLPLVANVNYNSGSVSEINTTTGKVSATIPVGENPQDIAWTPDGRFAYVVNNGSNTVSVVDTTTNRVTETIPTGAGPTSITIQPSGHQAYVNNLNSGTVTVLKLAPTG
jgi:YVTN family beta-propeller protein